MDAPWDARGIVAGIVGCDRDELTFKDKTDSNGLQVYYERAGQLVGRLTVAGPIPSMHGAPDSYYEIAFQEADGGPIHKFERVRDTGIIY
jgi:hypothetical protein